MAGRAQQRQGNRLLGYNIIEPVNLDTGVAEIRVGGTVLELVAGNGQLHPRERNQRKPRGPR